MELSQIMTESQAAISGYDEKTDAVIDELERNISAALAPCKSCGSPADTKYILSSDRDANIGYVYTVFCTGCSKSVSVFSRSLRAAKIRAVDYWGRRILDA